ncbi:MAG: polyprenyl synthetase family protein [Lentisphaerae bacterium]|nr:polyprenyl synthetase family protein [Lentisphaerota bacterium]
MKRLPSIGHPPAMLSQAMRHAVLTGGKRLRPIVTLAACEAATGDLNNAVVAAVAVELIHCYTLVHDDLPCMDNDTTRRGEPTVWKKFGEANAVLAGDALQTLAFKTIASYPYPNPATAALICAELASVAGADGVIGGQVIDLEAGSKADPATVTYVHQHKTAALFRGAARIGAIAAQASQETINTLGEYGHNLGLAFQVIDDILDAPNGTPSKPDELSCLHVMTIAEARTLAREVTNTACKTLSRLAHPDKATPLEELALNMLNRLT